MVPTCFVWNWDAVCCASNQKRNISYSNLTRLVGTGGVHIKLEDKWLRQPIFVLLRKRSCEVWSLKHYVFCERRGTFLGHSIKQVPDFGPDDHILKFPKGTFNPQRILHLPILTSIVTSCYIAVRKLQKMQNHWFNFAKRCKHSNKFCTCN